jgi:beta-mannanase
MNGDWIPANAAHTGKDPSAFVAAWRRIHALFRAEGANNAVWVWCPNYVDSPAEPWNHWTNYYPGDDVVDWVGIDAYSWGSTQPWTHSEHLSDMAGPIVTDYAGRKPIMLAEVGAAECDRHAWCKANWVAQARTWLKATPAIGALVWFDIDKEANWRVDSSPAALWTYQRLAADPYFNP